MSCVEDMQNNCEKNKAPFEVLVQGPSGSRFVRDLLAKDANAHKESVNPKNIATISVFQPNGNRKLTKREANEQFDDPAEGLQAAGNNILIYFSHENPMALLITSLFSMMKLVSGDTATIDEQTNNNDNNGGNNGGTYGAPDGAQSENKNGDPSADPKVGFALPGVGLLGLNPLPLGLAGLKLKTGCVSHS